MQHEELIRGFREARKNPIKRDKIFCKVLDQYFELITEILIRKGVSNVNIKDSIEYAVALTALYEALDVKFNPDSGFEFSTYLTHHIRLHLTRHFAGFVCGVSRFASSYDTTETMDRKVYQSDLYSEYVDDSEDSFSFESDNEEAVPIKVKKEFPSLPLDNCTETLSEESEEVLGTPTYNLEVPLYEQLDNEESMDEELLSRFSAAATLGIKLLSGLAGYGKLGKIHVFRLTGTDHRKELSGILDSYDLVS